MAASFEINDGEVTITFTWTLPILKGQNRIDLMSQELFERGFEVENGTKLKDLTNQDKINKIYSYLTNITVDMSLDRNLKNKRVVADAEAKAEESNIK